MSPIVPQIPEDLCSSEPELQEITAVCMSPLEQTLAISTRQGQVYHFSITSTEISQVTGQRGVCWVYNDKESHVHLVIE